MPTSNPMPGTFVDEPFSPQDTWQDQLKRKLDYVLAPFQLPVEHPEHAATVAAEMTGVPSLMRGGEDVYDGFGNGSGSEVAHGAGEMILGALPGMGLARVAATPMKLAGLSGLGGGLAATSVDDAEGAEVEQPAPFSKVEADPVLEALQGQLATLKKQRDDEYNGVAKGGTSGRKGDGPATQKLDARISEITQQIADHAGRRDSMKLETDKLAADERRAERKADLEENWWRPYVPNAVGAAVGALTGGISGRIAGGRQAAAAREFEALAGNIASKTKGKGNVVGTPAGDELAASIDAAYGAGGAKAPRFGDDIARMTNPASQQTIDRAIADRFENVASPESIAAKDGWGRMWPGKNKTDLEAEAQADAVARERSASFGEPAGPFDRIEPFADTTGSAAANFLKSSALPAAFATEGAVTQNFIAPRYEESDPEFANLLDRVANASYVAAGASKLGQMGGKATVGMKNSWKGAPGGGTKPSPTAVQQVEAGRNRLVRDLGTYRNPGAAKPSAGGGKPPAGPALPSGAVGKSPAELAAARAEKSKMIANSHADEKVLNALPNARTVKGEVTAPKLQQALKVQGLNVTRGQAGRMMKNLKAQGKI